MRAAFLFAFLSTFLPGTAYAGGTTAAEPAAAAKPGQWLRDSAPVVLGHSTRITSTLLKQTRPLHIYLPPGYQENDTRYPVLYLLDGAPHQDFTHIAGIAALAADWRYMQEFIVVGIESLDRYRELIHPTTVPEEQKRLPTAGEAALFRDFLGKELQPWVRENLRGNGQEVLMGESAAGMFVVETFLRRPSMFTGYAAISPMLWWNRESLSKEAAALLKNPGFSTQRLYISLANEGGEMATGVDRLVAALNAHAPSTLQWAYQPYPHEEHATIYHPSATAALRWLFRSLEDCPLEKSCKN